MTRRRLLTIAHSYCVAQNRRLAEEMARASGDEWDVVAVAPEFVHGDLRPIPLERRDAEACRLEAVPARWTKRIHVMQYGRRLGAILRDNWDIVHCWQEPFVVCAAQVAWWTPPSSRLIFATFQNIAKRYPPPFGWIERYSMRRSAGWIAFGQTVHETLHARAGYQARPSRIIPPGVDTDHFRPNREAGAAIRRQLGWTVEGPPVVGFLGRFVPEKGLPLLMRVLDQLPTDWRAMFVGGGPLEATLSAWAATHGDRVRVITGVSHDDVPPYLNAMDVLCAPSETTPHWREQLGRMLLEAFACGVPVIGSDSGEIPHVIGSAGLILPEADEPAWLEGLANLLADRTQRRELAERGRDRALTEFAWPLIARRHLNYFAELLDQPRRGANC